MDLLEKECLAMAKSMGYQIKQMQMGQKKDKFGG
jgi:hypothetical protein